MVGSATAYFFVVERLLRFLIAALRTREPASRLTVEVSASPKSSPQ
jgi:hypothetical protein